VLRKIQGKDPDGLCEQCHAEETIPHVILECIKHEEKKEQCDRINEKRKKKAEENISNLFRKA